MLKLHLLLGGDLQGRNVFPDQQSFYYPGVGTYGSWWDKLRNRALAPPEEDVVVQPSHLGRSHAQNEKAGAKELMYDYRMPRVSVNDVPSVYSPIIHHSVLDRMADDRDYQSTATIKNRVNPYTNQTVGVRVWFSAHDIRAFDSIDKARRAVSTKLHRLARSTRLA